VSADGRERGAHAVRLEPYSAEDIALTEALECDPEVMRGLGGPVPKDEIPAIHRRRLAAVAGGEWWFKVVPDPPGPIAGTIGIWETDWNGSPIHEIGWMLLPAFHGRGIGSAALEAILARARSDPRFERIHAFPATSNAASNALCRKFGFVHLGECDGGYRNRPLRCNHWELGLAPA
jgi:RimJ/RimL family protein N-acetyltransferase